MPTILIADACKPSLVMSSEVFKDKIGGANILVSTSGKHCLEVLTTEKPDMCVVDFDLPDTDGITLIHAMRKTYNGPILLTAYPDRIVEEAVKADLFAFNDAGAWIPKPVKFDVLADKIDQFLLDKFRLGRRFDFVLQTILVGKGAGRGKRAPKVTGRIVNISLGGACIALDGPLHLQNGEEMLLALALPGDGPMLVPVQTSPAAKSTTAKSETAKTKAAKSKIEIQALPEAKIKCTVAWVDHKSETAGFQFSRLTDGQRKGLEELLRSTVRP